MLLHRADIQALQWFGAKPNLGMDFTRAEEKEHLERGAVGCKTRQHYKLKDEGILLVSKGVYGAASYMPAVWQDATVYEEAIAISLVFISQFVVYSILINTLLCVSLSLCSNRVARSKDSFRTLNFFRLNGFF